MSDTNTSKSSLPLQILRIRDVCAMTGLSRTTIWRKVSIGVMPAPVRLGANAVGWYAHEVEEFLLSLPRVINVKHGGNCR